MSSRSSHRPGFAYLWAICTIGVIAILVATAAPHLAQINDVNRVDGTAQTLRDLAAGVDSFNLYAKRGSASFTTPALLSDLTTSIANGAPAGCTALTYNNTAVANWTAHAPYADFFVPGGGIWTPLGRVSDAPSRAAAVLAAPRTSTSDPYYIQIDSVDVELARMLDLAVDDTLNAGGGALQYTTPGTDSTVLVSYQVTLAHAPAC
jgi:hypothetical protein